MVDRLRLLCNRPLEDGDRPRLFLIVVALIAGAAMILALLDDAGPTGEPATPPAPPAAAAVPAAASALVPAGPAPATPSEESDPPAELLGSRTDIARSKQAARRFLAGYLPYTYGRRRANRIPAASAELRAQLGGTQPRVPTRMREQRPRLELLQSHGVSRERAQLVALVRDIRRRYTVRLELANTATGWLVTDLGH